MGEKVDSVCLRDMQRVVWGRFLAAWVLSSEERPRLEREIWKIVCGWQWLRWSREKGQARIDPRRSRRWYKRRRKGGHCGKSRPSSQGEGLFSQVSNELA